MTPILSILICTIEGREESLNTVFNCLNPLNATNKIREFQTGITQIISSYEGDGIEHLIYKDNKEISVGMKRQLLLQAATGAWIIFLDDDDRPSPYYVKRIVDAIWRDPSADCIGTWGNMTTNGVKPETWIHSLKYRKWESGKDGYTWNRPPIHFSPVKRTLALKAGFGNERFGEDKSYSMRLLRHLKRETQFIKEPLFTYQAVTTQSKQERYGITR